MMKKRSLFHLFGQRKQRRPKEQLEGPFLEKKKTERYQDRLNKKTIEVDILRERV